MIRCLRLLSGIQLEKLTSNRYYFDYNATSPFAAPVLDWLSKGDFAFSNPSSVHLSGKKVSKEIRNVRKYLLELFGLDQNVFELYFHSGATEGINNFLKGTAFYGFKKSLKYHYFYTSTDHSCVANSLEDCRDLGHHVEAIDVDQSGTLNRISLEKKLTHNSIVNFTWVNNESGVVFPLEWARELKEKTGCLIHVDAVQAVGKVENWNKLEKEVDAYTFSAHKFGALKGVGFSFIKKSVEIAPLIRGGGQQFGLRSGTENSLGILSIPLALEEIKKTFQFQNQISGKNYLEKNLIDLLGDKGEIVAALNPHRNGQTIYFILYDTKAQISAMAFDMAGMDVSNGSACSSGAVIPSRVLLAMGKTEKEALSAIRLSFSHSFNLEDAKTFWPLIKDVIQKYL